MKLTSYHLYISNMVITFFLLIFYVTLKAIILCCESVYLQEPLFHKLTQGFLAKMFVCAKQNTVCKRTLNWNGSWDGNKIRRWIRMAKKNDTFVCSKKLCKIHATFMTYITQFVQVCLYIFTWTSCSCKIIRKYNCLQ